MATKNIKANKTKSISHEPKEKVEVNSALVEENANLKAQLTEMVENYKEMQLQLQNMLIAQQAQKIPANNDDDIVVGCRIFNGATLSSVGGDIIIPVGYREETEVKAVELREIFKSPFGYKHMFRKGTLYFVDEANYKRFGITKEIDLSDDSLIELLENNNENMIIEKIKQMTTDKHDLMEVFAIIYQIAYLIDHKKINLDYEVRHNLEKYLNVDFKDLISNFYQK